MKTIIYLIQVSACTGIFYLFYHLILSRLTFFSINRWYLLGTLMLSFIIPLITIPHNQITEQVSFSAVGEEYVVYATRHEASVSGNGVDWMILLPVFYYIVAGLLAIYFLISLYSIYGMIRKEKGTSLGKVKVYKESKFFRNSSFLNYIFIDNSDLDEAEIKQVIEHEMVHIEQMHSVDKIIVRLSQIVLWFNPFIYAYVNAIDANHEYQVDHIVSQNADKEVYTNLILRLAASGNTLLGHQFSKFPLSRRITMLFNKPSKNMKKVNYVLALPLVAMSCLVFANKDLKSANIIAPEKSASENVAVVQNAPKKEIVVQNTVKKPIDVKTAPEKKEAVLVQNEVQVNVQPQQVMRIDSANFVRRPDSMNIVPHFPGGLQAWGKFLQKYNYPPEAATAKAEGKVFVEFIVETDGSLSDIKIVKDLGHGTGEEAIRLMKTSPKWVPGIQNGRAVRVKYTQPITLSIN